MKEDKMKLLVAALRSGEYMQGRDTLRYGDNFCCLGVACEVYRKETGEGKWEKDEDYTPFRVGEERQTADLPLAVRDWFGFSLRNPQTEEETLIRLNDTENQSFAAIADFIEKNWEAL